MGEYTFECPNCGANCNITLPECDRCQERRDAPGTGRPRFSGEARDIGLGGLLKLYEAQGRVVRYVGRCAGGALGLDEAGNVVWVEDWGYLSTLECEGSVLKLDGKLADIDTGKLIVDVKSTIRWQLGAWRSRTPKQTCMAPSGGHTATPSTRSLWRRSCCCAEPQ